jgi:hypothetical protein
MRNNQVEFVRRGDGQGFACGLELGTVCVDEHVVESAEVWVGVRFEFGVEGGDHTVSRVDANKMRNVRGDCVGEETGSGADF